MKKYLLTALMAAVSGLASAQSSVTLFGTVDETLAIGRGSVANRTQLTTSGYNSSRLGFRGDEDLGGGMLASFWLEAGVSVDSGAGVATNTNNQLSGIPAGTPGLTFNRRSTVSLTGPWGELRLGRDISAQFYNIGEFDPFTTNGVGTTQILNSSLGGPVSVRVSNAITYFLPAVPVGFYGLAQAYLGENASDAGATRKDGTGAALLGGYNNGAFKGGVAYSNTKYATGDTRQLNTGGQWDLGVVKLFGQYESDRVASPVPVNGKGWLLGSNIPVGVGVIRLAYSTYKTDAAGTPKTDKLAMGYVYNLSKRTAIYGTYARLSNSGGAAQALNAAVTAPNQASSGLQLGVRHHF